MVFFLLYLKIFFQLYGILRTSPPGLGFRQTTPHLEIRIWSKYHYPVSLTARESTFKSLQPLGFGKDSQSNSKPAPFYVTFVFHIFPIQIFKCS